MRERERERAWKGHWKPGTEAENACPFKQQSFYGHLIVCLLLFCTRLLGRLLSMLESWDFGATVPECHWDFAIFNRIFGIGDSIWDWSFRFFGKVTSQNQWVKPASGRQLLPLLLAWPNFRNQLHRSSMEMLWSGSCQSSSTQVYSNQLTTTW